METPLKAFKGDQASQHIQGRNKVAGWHPESGDGAVGTYNDVAEVVVEGNTVQVADYYSKDGASEQVQTVQGKNLLDMTKLINIRADTTGAWDGTTLTVTGTWHCAVPMQLCVIQLIE